jgi:hypothetical protein
MANKGPQTAKGKMNKMSEGDGRKTPFKESKEKLKKQIKF